MRFKFFSLQAASILLTITLGGCAVDGCIDPAALNFNPDATRDNGSCLIEGCTDANAPNFNQDANLDDGTCLCPEGEQPTLTVVAGPNAVGTCIPDVVLNTDTIAFQLMAGDSVVIELDQVYFHDVRTILPIISACTQEDTLILGPVCGENFRWVPLSD